MNFTEFREQFADAPTCFQSELRLYLRSPTKSKASYIAGYVAALNAVHLFKTEDVASYWLAVIGSVERNPDLNGDLLAEIDNLPVTNGRVTRDL